MAERYDAAIIGAGADGLAAATLLEKAGLDTIVLERHAEPGGRLVTREFHPGFWASPFTDDVAPIPDDLFWALDLAQHGAIATPSSPPLGLWPDRVAQASPAVAEFGTQADARRGAALAYAQIIEPPPVRKWWSWHQPLPAPWPSESWSHEILADRLAADLTNGDDAALAMASALEGRAADPLAAGSALHLLTPQGGMNWRGGLASLGSALAASARAAGATIACGLDVTDIHCAKGSVAALTLADGTEIQARAVISTLDLKRTFLSLFKWSELPKETVRAIGDFRIAGSTARILFALSTRPKPPLDWPDGFPRGPLHVMPDTASRIAAHAAWRSGTIAERLPLTLRFPSAADPSLAPIGACVMTATVSCVPHTLFDGAWTHEKRDLLGNRILDLIEEVLPGIAATVVGVDLMVPPDIEEALGHTNGDLDGGEYAPDQMNGFRPFADRKSPYTPVTGLYLAGPSSAAAPYATCAAGAVAARAVLADLANGRLP